MDLHKKIRIPIKILIQNEDKHQKRCLPFLYSHLILAQSNNIEVFG